MTLCIALENSKVVELINKSFLPNARVDLSQMLNEEISGGVIYAHFEE